MSKQFEGLEADVYRTELLPLLGQDIINFVKVSKRAKQLASTTSYFKIPVGEPVIETLSHLFTIADKDERFMKNETLTSLDLSEVPITSRDIEFIARHFPNIRTLNLSQAMRGQLQLQRIESFSHLSKMQFLTHLNMRGNHLGDVSVQELAPHCGNLKSLNIASSNMTVEGMLALVRHCKSLTHLDLSWNGLISDAGGTVLAQLPDTSKLNSLILKGIQLTDQVKALLQNRYKKKL